MFWRDIWTILGRLVFSTSAFLAVASGTVWALQTDGALSAVLIRDFIKNIQIYTRDSVEQIALLKIYRVKIRRMQKTQCQSIGLLCCCFGMRLLFLSLWLLNRLLLFDSCYYRRNRLIFFHLLATQFKSAMIPFRGCTYTH